MTLPDEAERTLLSRYRREIDQLVSAGGKVTLQAFRRIGSLDEAAIARFIDEAGPALRDVSARAGASASGVAAMLTDSPVGVPGVADPAWRDPFTSGWRALGNGAEFDDAFEQAASVADATGRNAVASTAREAVGASAPAGTKWRRITDADPCEWCVMVAQKEYNSAESANFGHDRCACMVVPAASAANAPGAQSEFGPVEGTAQAVGSVDYGDSVIPYRRQVYDDILQEIDQLHGMPAGTNQCIVDLVPVDGQNHGRFGMIKPQLEGGTPGDRRTWMTVNEYGLKSETFTFTHEFGHRLDMLPDYTWYSNGSTPAVKEFFGAASKSDTLTDAIKSFVDNGDAAYASYLGDKQEVWARAYSQWVVKHSKGGQTADWLRDSFFDVRSDRVGWQWSDREFDKVIGPRVEAVLRERGLLR